MKNVQLLIALFVAISTATFAQFPGGGGFGGGGRGGERGGSSQMNNMPSTPSGNGRISGTVIDSASSKPVEYATIALFDKKTNKIIDGTTAGPKGEFLIKSLPEGDFKVVVSFLGYKNTEFTDVSIARGKKEQNLGNVKLASDSQLLGEVTVTGQKALIEDKIDRLVYNAERDISNAGGDASDVLRKVPMLSVDLDGNVSMRGSQNIKVLINGKPSTIVANSVADALKMIPSDQIKSVEVITSPSAKYDAEGSAGIINIITKKNNLQGLTGSIDASGGNRSSNLNGNINLKTKKLGISISGGGRFFYPPNGGFTNISRVLPNGQTLATRQENDGRQLGGYGNISTNIDYEINAYNNITFGARLSQRQFNNTNTQQSFNVLNGGTPIPTFGNLIDVKNVGKNIDLNLDYTRKFAKADKELNVLVLYSNNNGDNTYTRDQYRGLDQNRLFYREQNPNLSTTKEKTLQIDYQDPLSKHVQMETGVKAILRTIESDARFNFDSTGRGTSFISNPDRANVFNYDQNVYSGYLSFLFQTTNKWGFKPGLRYEYTQLDATFREGAPRASLNNFGTFAPSLTISKSLKGGKTVRVSYNRRIQRPSIRFLNPNVAQSDPFNISFGNPKLNTEFTNNFELNFSTFFKTTTINVSTYARLTDNSIESVSFRGGQAQFDLLVAQQGLLNASGVVVNDNTLLTTFQNAGKNQTYGFNFFGSVRPTSKLSLNASFDLQYININGTIQNRSVSNSGATFNLFGQVQQQLGKNWSAQLFGFVRAREIQLQGTRGGFGVYSLNILKEFKKQQASLGFGAENFLSNTFKQRSALSSDVPGNVFTQENVNFIYNRGFKVTYRQRFGKMSFDGNLFRRKKSINNDDQKNDSSANDGAGGGGGRRGGS
jgi:ferric enterobactin receptor